jgi:hypothetical protein
LVVVVVVVVVEEEEVVVVVVAEVEEEDEESEDEEGEDEDEEVVVVEEEDVVVVVVVEEDIMVVVVVEEDLVVVVVEEEEEEEEEEEKMRGAHFEASPWLPHLLILFRKSLTWLGTAVAFLDAVSKSCCSVAFSSVSLATARAATNPIRSSWLCNSLTSVSSASDSPAMAVSSLIVRRAHEPHKPPPCVPSNVVPTM